MVMNLQLSFHNGMHLLANSATLTSQQHLHSGREPPLHGIDVIMKIDVLSGLRFRAGAAAAFPKMIPRPVKKNRKAWFRKSGQAMCLMLRPHLTK